MQHDVEDPGFCAGVEGCGGYFSRKTTQGLCSQCDLIHKFEVEGNAQRAADIRVCSNYLLILQAMASHSVSHISSPILNAKTVVLQAKTSRQMSVVVVPGSDVSSSSVPTV